MRKAMLAAAAVVVLGVPGEVWGAPPDPGQGSAPPGSAGIIKLLGWGAWIGFALCVLGVIISGAMMAVGALNGGHNHGHGSRLMWVFAGCIVVASASGLVGAFI